MKDTVVFTFGRFNPPTTGHEKLIEKLASVAKKEGADFMVFPSHSQNDKKDPLDHKTKVGFMKKMFPKYSRNIISNRNAKTAFMIAPMLYDMGYKRCIMVVGGDRVTEFKTTLNKYNGKKGSHGFYDFKDGIEVVSAGERDPDAEGVAGMSASKMRAAAAANDYDSFKNGLPSSFEKSNGKKLFDALRKAMNISEELSEFLEATNSDFSRFIETEFVEIVEDIEDEMLIESVYKELDFKIGIDDDYATVYKRIYNNEEVSQKQIDDLEKFADRMLAKYDIDVTFTRHFVDRMNDTRNDPEIKVAELQKFFKKIQKKKGSQIKANPDIEAVLKDMSTNLNLPVVINYKDGEFEVVHKTVMRKKNFSTSSKELKYESLEEANYQVDIEGLPTFYVDASSAGEVKNGLRKLLKNPKVIKDVEKVTDGEIKKDFRDRITGKDEGVSRAQQAAIAIAKKKSGKYDKDGNKLEDFKMNPEREKDLENIAKDLPDDDFKKRYGDEWMQVKMATAMNILKKKLGYSTEDLEEIACNEDAEIKSFSQFLFERKTTQDPDIKDKEGSQPKKYYAKDADGDEMSKSTKDKRAAYFKKQASKPDDSDSSYKPAPGDANAKTKESEHTKKYRQMYGEALDKPYAIKWEYLKPKGPSSAIAKLDDGSALDIHISEDPDGIYEIEFARGQSKKNMARTGQGDEFRIFATVQAAMLKWWKQLDKTSARKITFYANKQDGNRARLYKRFLKMWGAKSKWDIEVNGNAKPGLVAYTLTNPTPEKSKNDKKTFMQKLFRKEETDLEEKNIAGLVAKADESGISYEILKKVYDRGMAAWKGGHRPGTTSQQWAFARVNSFITGGKTRTTGDADLWAKVKK